MSRRCQRQVELELHRAKNSPGRGERRSVKLSERTLWECKSPPGKADPPPEASFASSPAKAARSVNSDG